MRRGAAARQKMEVIGFNYVTLARKRLRVSFIWFSCSDWSFNRGDDSALLVGLLKLGEHHLYMGRTAQRPG